MKKENVKRKTMTLINPSNLKIMFITFILDGEKLKIKGIGGPTLNFINLPKEFFMVRTVEISGIKEISNFSIYSVFLDEFLQNVIFSDTMLKTIGENTFIGCRNLKNIILSESITSINEEAFAYCNSLESITIPNNVTKIGESSFFKCEKLKNVILQNGISKICKNAFLFCTGLESIVIPDSVTEIGIGAFKCCKSLRNICISNSITKLENDTFASCIYLENVVIPNSVNILCEGVFFHCVNLKSIVIPESVVEIGKSAFDECNNLSEIIPSSGKFSSSLIQILCENDINLAKILFKELFTNTSYFISINSIICQNDVVITLLKSIMYYPNNEFNKIILEYISVLDDLDTINVLIYSFQSINCDYWKFAIDELNERYKIVTSISNNSFTVLKRHY